MKKLSLTLAAFFLCSILLVPQASAGTVTFTDPANDAIGVDFETYSLTLTNLPGDSGHLLGIEIVTDYPEGGVTVGGWQTFAADLFLSDQTGNYAVPLINHDGFIAGTWYAVDNYAVSDDFDPQPGSYIYNHDVPVWITQGTAFGYQASVTWISTGATSGKWIISLPEGNVYEGMGDTPMHVLWATATCANDVIEGDFPVPEPGIVILLGISMLGVIGYGWKRGY
ncbi:MAG: PEP-CTERM sorting domain-containing protein [Acidobacteria bacterium]|nr:PEP-CTERM sorting domain-containing protein [Acidobacteriota bacterium]